ncbi:MAG: hypothetical protein F6K50_40940 [Moorea sp. SIO3I7]|uniref:hypothetical protein n=1 Tax=unclassified Moorena TaxID=2683338 RepID=UPI0013BF3625|nr:MULTISPECIES: hypothetical protein [unclassified Moorena]NEO01535.1 hypothetical protein [Moorena sp. SIO3I7]NEO06017.1 hypothetical protein [Moorena sp. SIO3I8]NEO19344.1 hypothetical protein [Moorena sp. SIO4A5]NEP20582.1 hypothetical protein [Moorena sp. SIO3I6]NEQ59748.1 hypothetical protein [Moorena sp. SIO4A1]
MVINLTRKVFGLITRPLAVGHATRTTTESKMSCLTATDDTVLKRSGLGKHPDVRTKIRLNGLVKHGQLVVYPSPNLRGWGY